MLCFPDTEKNSDLKTYIDRRNDVLLDAPLGVLLDVLLEDVLQFLVVAILVIGQVIAIVELDEATADIRGIIQGTDLLTEVFFSGSEGGWLNSIVDMVNESEIPDTILENFGRDVMGEPGAILGSVLAKGGKAYLNSIVRGSGDYTIKANSITGTDTVPMFGGNSSRVKNKEFIKDISSSATAGNFKIESFRINPADSNTFPWLSEVAEQFSEYRLHGLLFEYKTTSSDALNSTNTALGTVIMATQYNSYEDDFTNKQFMENSTYACSAKPSCSLVHGIECSKFENPVNVMYLAAGVPGEGDLRMYDIGKFSIASTGLQGTSVTIGELWVTYDVELIKPREISPPDLLSHFALNQPSNASPLGASFTSQFGNDFGITLNTTNRTISWPKSYTGLALTIYQITGSAVTVVTPTFTPSAGATAVNDFYLGGTNNGNDQTIAGGTSTTLTVVKLWQITGGGVVTVGNAGTIPAGALVVGDLTVMTVPNNMAVVS